MGFLAADSEAWVATICTVAQSPHTHTTCRTHSQNATGKSASPPLPHVGCLGAASRSPAYAKAHGLLYMETSSLWDKYQGNGKELPSPPPPAFGRYRRQGLTALGKVRLGL